MLRRTNSTARNGKQRQTHGPEATESQIPPPPPPKPIAIKNDTSFSSKPHPPLPTVQRQPKPVAPYAQTTTMPSRPTPPVIVIPSHPSGTLPMDILPSRSKPPSPMLIVSPPDQSPSFPVFEDDDLQVPSPVPRGHGRSLSDVSSKYSDGQSLMTTLSGSYFGKKQKQKHLSISTPFDPIHLTHMGVDSSTGQFTGVPKHWKKFLQEGGISAAEQEKNPQVITQIVNFCEKRPTLKPSVTLTPSSSSPSTPHITPPGSPASAGSPLSSSPEPPAVPRKPSVKYDLPTTEDASQDTDGSPKRRDPLEPLAEFMISPDRLEFVKHGKLTRGGFGDVRRALLWPESRSDKSSIEVAVKELRFGNGLPVKRAKKRFARESLVWVKLEHPNIVPFIGYHFDDKKIEAWLICPWHNNGNVGSWLAKRQLYLRERLRFIRDTAEALKYLHSQNPPIVHGDIKAANVLVTGDTRAVLCDFGLAKALDGSKGLTTTETLKGSIPWCSPELFDNAVRSPASDVWAWAWLVWEIMTGEMPFSGITAPVALMYKIITGTLPDVEKHSRFSLISQLATLVRRCWAKDPALRPTMEQCIEVLDTHWERDGSMRRIPTPPPVVPSADRQPNRLRKQRGARSQ